MRIALLAVSKKRANIQQLKFTIEKWLKLPRDRFNITICKPATPLNDANHGGLFFMRKPNSYNKSALSPETLLKNLKNQGLIITDYQHAFNCLKTVSYHRLTYYFEPFMLHPHGQQKFKLQTAYEEIWRLYEFDRELRLLVSDALERIEVAFRTAISDSMSIQYNPHWYMKSEHFKNQKIYYQFKNQINEICEREKQFAMKHYFDKYDYPQLPPSWIIIEHLSFGSCTSAFRNLKLLSDRKAICKIFGYHPTAIASWIDALRYTRNLCAHHARLWNRWFIISPKLSYLYGKNFDKENTFYEQAIIIQKLLSSVSSHSQWKKKLHTLFENNPSVPIEQMGFQKNWKTDSFWQPE